MTPTTFLNELMLRGVHIRAEGDKLKLDAPAGILTPDDRQKLQEHKAELLAALSEQRPKSARELVAEALARHECPDCHCPLDLQDKALDTWFCASCRSWFGGNDAPTSPRPLTLERAEAEKLLADLQAVGCGVGWDGDELRITNLSKIPTALWIRLENAGAEFMKAAREQAAAFAECSDWVN